MMKPTTKAVNKNTDTRLIREYHSDTLEAMRKLAAMTPVQIDRAQAGHEYWQCRIDKAWFEERETWVIEDDEVFDDSDIDLDDASNEGFDEAVRKCGTQPEPIGVVVELLDYLTPMGHASETDLNYFWRDMEVLRALATPARMHRCSTPAFGSLTRGSEGLL